MWQMRRSFQKSGMEGQGCILQQMEMRQFLQTQSSRVTEYDEQMVRRLIEKITVYDDKFVFEFKSGMTIDLKR